MSTELNLDEHAPRGGNIPSPMGYTPTPEESKDIKMVYDLLEKSKEWRRRYDHPWNGYYRMFRGKQWKEQRPSYRHSEVINMIFQVIQSFVPILSDAKPKIAFLPEEPSDIPFADVLNSLMTSDWEKGKWLMSVCETLYDAHFYGTGFGGVKYDPKAMGGKGMIVHESCDPYYCYPDPDATDVNTKSDFFIYAEPVSVSKLKAEHPKFAPFIKGDLVDLAKEKRSDLYSSKFRSPTDAAGFVESDNQDGRSGMAMDKALKITCYVRPSEFEERAKEEAIGGEPKTVYEQVLKYPKGRYLCVINGVLVDQGAIINDDLKFPYAKLVNYMLPREFFGISEIEQLESPQKIFNKLVSFALDVLTLMGNPVWILDDDSNVEEENLVNRPGLVITKTKGSEVRRQEGVQLQPYVLQMVDRMKSWFDDISGSTDVTRGVEPSGGITAASAIQSLQQAAQTRLRLKSKYIDQYLQDLGELWLDLALKVFDAPRVFRQTNDQLASRYFRFHVEHAQDEEGNVMLDEQGLPIRKGVMTPYRQGQDGVYTVGERQEFPVKGRFDVRITTGSGLPFAKQEKFAMAKSMYKDGVIDRMEYLKASDWPNWEAVEQRMATKEAEQSQLEMASKVPQASPIQPMSQASPNIG